MYYCMNCILYVFEKISLLLVIKVRCINSNNLLVIKVLVIIVRRDTQNRLLNYSLCGDHLKSGN